MDGWDSDRAPAGVPPAYAAVVERLLDSALLFDETGTLVHGNRAALARLGGAGLDPTQVDADDVASLVAPEDRDQMARAMELAASGQPVPSTRLHLVHRHGRRIVTSCTFTPLELDGRSFVQVLAQDVTVRSELEQALRISEAQFRALFDHSPVGVAIVDGCDFRVVNPAMGRILGRDPSTLVGMSADDVTAPEDLHLNRALSQALATDDVARLNKRYLRPDGTVVWGELSAVRTVGPDGRMDTLVHLRDVSAEREAVDRLSHQALHDALTGVGNRALLQQRLVEVGGDRRGSIAVLFLDLDGFKRINDAFGHAVGDEVLAVTARRLQEVARPTDTVTRWGGDEFVIVLSGLHDRDEVLSIVRRVEDCVAEPIGVGGEQLLVTVSVGVAFAHPGERIAMADLVHDADTAMYAAKLQGRNRHSVFDETLRNAGAHRSHVEELLRRAIVQDRIVLHFQPVFELPDRRIVGVEALLRLREDDGSLLLPGDFLVIAEQTGLLLDLEAVVVERACAEAEAWRLAGHDLSVSVNVCAGQLAQIEEFERAVRAALVSSGLPPALLVCEITEPGLLEIDERTVAGVNRLRALGVQFSVDDFGTGYASVNHLLALPVQEVKVDRALVSRAGADPAAAAVVRAVSGLARELQMRCVAEGVEDEASHAVAVRLGADRGQGYLYGRPVPAAALRSLLTPV